MTPALQILLAVRRAKTEQEVEAEFNNRQKMIASGQILDTRKQREHVVQITQDDIVDQTPKSQSLLLESQIATLHEIYTECDKYNDQILKRQDYLMALRTDDRIVDFIDLDAVKVAAARPKVLTFDQVLVEIEKDEMYEMMHQSKREDTINHKEFITWSEFLSYF